MCGECVLCFECVESGKLYEMAALACLTDWTFESECLDIIKINII